MFGTWEDVLYFVVICRTLKYPDMLYTPPYSINRGTIITRVPACHRKRVCVLVFVAAVLAAKTRLHRVLGSRLGELTDAYLRRHLYKERPKNQFQSKTSRRNFVEH